MSLINKNKKEGNCKHIKINNDNALINKSFNWSRYRKFVIYKKIYNKSKSIILLNEELYNSTLGLIISQKVRSYIYFSYNSRIFS